MIEPNIMSRVETKSSILGELFSALSKAQDEIRVAVKDSSNPFFKSKYANLQAIIESSRPALCKNGLAVIQQVVQNDHDQDCLVTILGHSSGQWISSSMRIMPQKADVQALGSYITYLRRYSYASLVGVYDGEDDDGNAAVHEAPAKALIATRSQIDALVSIATPTFIGELLAKHSARNIEQLTEAQVRIALDRLNPKK